MSIIMEFPRFPPQKQAQIQQLASYALLMNLDGADLVSIGRKLIRVQQRLRLLELRHWWKNLNPQVCWPGDTLMQHSFELNTDGGRYTVTKTHNHNYSTARWWYNRVLVTNSVSLISKEYCMDAAIIAGVTRTERWRLSVVQQLQQGTITLDF